MAEDSARRGSSSGSSSGSSKGASQESSEGTSDHVETEVDTSAVATLFDLRSVIAILFGVFGVILLVVAFTDTTQTELAKAGGIRINLWTGVAMLIAAALFVVWVRLKPPIVGAAEEDDEAAGAPDA